jgi:hypothetical protein
VNLKEARELRRKYENSARTISEPELARVYLQKAAELDPVIAELEKAGGGVTPDITKSVTPSAPRRTLVPRTGVVADLGKAHVHHTESDLLREAERLDGLEKLASDRGDSDSARQWHAQSEEVQAKAIEMRKAAGFTTPLRKMIIGGKTTYLDMEGEADELEKSAAREFDLGTRKDIKDRVAQIREDVTLEKAAQAARARREGGAPGMLYKSASDRPPTEVDTQRAEYLRMANAVGDPEIAAAYRQKAAELEEQVSTFDRFTESDRCIAKAVDYDQWSTKAGSAMDAQFYRDLAAEQRELARKLRREGVAEGANPW